MDNPVMQGHRTVSSAKNANQLRACALGDDIISEEIIRSDHDALAGVDLEMLVIDRVKT